MDDQAPEVTQPHREILSNGCALIGSHASWSASPGLTRRDSRITELWRKSLANSTPPSAPSLPISARATLTAREKTAHEFLSTPSVLLEKALPGSTRQSQYSVPKL